MKIQILNNTVITIQCGLITIKRQIILPANENSAKIDIGELIMRNDGERSIVIKTALVVLDMDEMNEAFENMEIILDRLTR